MIVTGTRAEWGLLSPLARALDVSDDVKVSVVATNMHLDRRRGHTIDEIIADGFEVAAQVPMDTDSDSEAAKVKAMAQCLNGMADVITTLHPDGAIILGDRFEMLAVASACLLMHVPIIHIAGGETSEGAVDDSIRHAITKMASLHLTATEAFRRRLIAMGEQPDRVINTGAIGVYNLLTGITPMSRRELEQSIGIDLTRPTILLTYHPATLDTVPAGQRFSAVIEAIDRIDNLQVLVTYPNNDAGGEQIISLIEQWHSRRPDDIIVVPSLGKRRYLSVLNHVNAVVGNSSSGLVEVPSAHIPTVDIGMRQQGRLAGDTVIHSGDSPDQIETALRHALSPAGQQAARRGTNPYYKPDTLRLMTDAIRNLPLTTIKKFHD